MKLSLLIAIFYLFIVSPNRYLYLFLYSFSHAYARSFVEVINNGNLTHLNIKKCKIKGEIECNNPKHFKACKMHK